MEPETLRAVLSRWETSSPIILAAEVNGDLGHIAGALWNLSILRQIAPAGTTDCSECGKRCRVNFISDESGVKYGLIHCHDCGLARVPDGQLKRWEINTGSFLAAAFSSINVAVLERVAGQLWQVGKANWVGRSREVWFARAYRRNEVAATVQELNRRPKAILFAPTEVGAGRWQEATRNLVLALESALSFDDGEFVFDFAYVESRIVDAGLASGSTANRRPRKRADRAANIELLRKEMIAHLRAARDYAFETKRLTGEPALLPRPTQKTLGKLAGLAEWDVSRCMKDENAKELRLYWEAAANLDKIMTWKGPIKRGPAVS